MKIVLSGVETNNKGAELMLYAILQELERKHPDAEVYISRSRVLQGLDYIKTNLKVKFLPMERIVNGTHINGVLRRLGLPQILCMNYVKADYFFDGSGFLFSDHCKLWGTTPSWWKGILSNLYNNNAKIIFLPQAFGPFETDLTKKAISILNKYSSVIMAREQISYDFIKDTGLVDMKKVCIFSDFTSHVEGVFPVKYEHLRGGICVIPSTEMVRQNKISYDDYIKLLTNIVNCGKDSGHPVYLLNHEGKRDEIFCNKCKESMGGNIEVITDLNGLEVKGLISSAYLVITSRYHGLASALNSMVPSLATSWSHKYEELYRDYKLEGYILPINDISASTNRVSELINPEENKRIREHLKKEVPLIKAQTEKMWNYIWKL